MAWATLWVRALLIRLAAHRPHIMLRIVVDDLCRT